MATATDPVTPGTWDPNNLPSSIEDMGRLLENIQPHDAAVIWGIDLKYGGPVTNETGKVINVLHKFWTASDRNVEGALLALQICVLWDLLTWKNLDLKSQKYPRIFDNLGYITADPPGQPTTITIWTLWYKLADPDALHMDPGFMGRLLEWRVALIQLAIEKQEAARTPNNESPLIHQVHDFTGVKTQSICPGLLHEIVSLLSMDQYYPRVLHAPRFIGLKGSISAAIVGSFERKISQPAAPFHVEDRVDLPSIMPPGFPRHATYCQNEDGGGPPVRVDQGDTVKIERPGLLQRLSRKLSRKLSQKSAGEVEELKPHEHKPSQLQGHLPPNKGWGGTLLTAPERCPDALKGDILEVLRSVGDGDAQTLSPDDLYRPGRGNQNPRDRPPTTTTGRAPSPGDEGTASGSKAPVIGPFRPSLDARLDFAA